ncbi:MAG: glycosyltransferase [Lachnospiraceae bacterium]|nr:glycosyltransferase [Lachnospiraceae bacterium]
MKQPLISVIMSTYNDELYIEESLRSILNQTLADFELIIYDDCSTDHTVEKIRAFHDPRIQLICNEENCGLTKNLNKGLRIARGKYIARMDGDDISEQTRFERQVAFLEEHPSVYLISCHAQNFGESDLVNRIRGNSEVLRCRMLIRPVFAHPGFMMRRELIEEGFFYDETFRTAQDYEFAVRAAGTHEIGMVPEILLHYRVHKKQISNTVNDNQVTNADRVRQKQLGQLKITLSGEEQQVYNDWVYERKPQSFEEFLEASALLQRFVTANEKTGIYDGRVLEKTLKRLLYTWAIRNKNLKYICRFPKICGYLPGNMLLFVGEAIRTIGEKVS